MSSDSSEQKASDSTTAYTTDLHFRLLGLDLNLNLTLYLGQGVVIVTLDK